MNVQGALVEEDELIDCDYSCGISPTKNDCKIEEIISKLKNAKRPLIVAGHGIRLSGQKSNFIKLLDKFKIPVVTTFNGFDLIPDNHPCFIGRIGTIGQRCGNFALQNADVVLFLGSRNNIRQISYNWENFAKNAYKIIVDIDNAELQKPTVKPDMAIKIDLEDFLPLFAESAYEITKPDWLDFCKKLKEKYSFENTAEYKHTDKINAYGAVRRITELLPQGAACVLGNATAIIASMQTALIKENQRYFSNSGDASMGYDVPAAIGACVASGNQSTFCITGDGSIMMNIQELQTIKHNNLPVKIFIINNDGYISIKQTQNNFFEGRNTGAGTNSGVSIPDFVKVGSAFGIESFRITRPDEIDGAINKMINSKTPLICEIMVNPDYIFSPKLSSKKLADGTMISPSLEDMYPFLPREEFEQNMIKD